MLTGFGTVVLENKVSVPSADEVIETTFSKRQVIVEGDMATRPRAIRVLTADSNQMACRLLAEALSKEPGLSVVASASDYDSMMRCWQSAKPDIALISAALPGGLLVPMRGAAPETRSLPTCPWVLLLDESEPQVVVSAFRAGAKGSSPVRNLTSDYWPSAFVA